MKHPEWRPENNTQALGHLAEEAGELVQMVGRIFRFGLVTSWVDPTGNTNKEMLRNEIADVEIAIERVKRMIYGESPELELPEDREAQGRAPACKVCGPTCTGWPHRGARTGAILAVGPEFHD